MLKRPRAHSLVLIDVGETLTYMSPFNPDLGNFIASKREQGYRIIIVTETTSQKMARHFLRYTQLDERFWPQIYGPLIKSDPDNWRGVAAEHRYTPDRCIAIDNLPENIMAAKKAGMTGILFRSKIQDVESAYTTFDRDGKTRTVRGNLLVLEEMIRSLMPPPAVSYTPPPAPSRPAFTPPPDKNIAHNSFV